MAGRNLFAEDQAVQPQENMRRMNEEIGPFQAGAIAAGRGLTGIGRAIGLADPEPEFVTEAYKGLTEQQPLATGIGAVVGEALPFLPAGVGVGAIQSLAPRVATSIGLGITGGGLIARS